ncbi:MAG: hypothetical protein WC364_07210 [Eubacteriales bacterium]
MYNISKDDWIISEEGFDKQKTGFWETIFTLGNGYLGSRGVLEESFENGYPGNYLAGIYDQAGSQPFEIVNAPNPLRTEIYINGGRLSVNEMKIAEHRRVLDLKKAVLHRRTVFQNDQGRYEYESARFFSLKDFHAAVMVFSLKPLDCDAEITVKRIIDGTTENAVQAVGDPVKHYSVRDCSFHNPEGAVYLEAKTINSGQSIGMAADLEFSGRSTPAEVRWAVSASEEIISRECSFKAAKGKRYTFTSFISIYTSRDKERSIKKSCLESLSALKVKDAAAIFKAHCGAWGKRWANSDFLIDGEAFLQNNMRLNIYHLLIAVPPEDLDVSIPAKTLSGEWYKGHIFWDAEIFVLPFFVFTQPELAKNLLLYRYRRLKQARAKARGSGYEGAWWPWESAESGDDETPETWINYDGTVIPVHVSKREIHIAGDIIYGVVLYYLATSDREFMLRYGAEMVFETARFWATRVNYNSEKDYYEIKDVIGPNEFQECVDNNFYTNYMARWNLRYAAELYDLLAKEHPLRLNRLAKKIELKKEEIQSWREISKKIIAFIDQDGLIEEFEGYFSKKEFLIQEWDKDGMPVWPASLDLAEVKDTQLVKQADVILLIRLFATEFDGQVKKVNHDFYEKRTTHKSSLSLPSYAITALELGNIRESYKHFMQAVRADYGNLYGNTELGVHAAALGGAWQIAGYGFTGLKIKEGILSVNPVLPGEISGIRLNFWFRNALFELKVANVEEKLEVEVLFVRDRIRNREGIWLEICGEKCFLSRGQKVRRCQQRTIGEVPVTAGSQR